MSLADLIAPGAIGTSLHFLDENSIISLGEMWDQGQAVCAWNASHGGEPIGMILSNSQACATVLIGAIASGATVVSLPPPPRGADLEWYVTFLESACSQSSVGMLVVDDQYISLLPPGMIGVAYATYSEILKWRGRGDSTPEQFTLVQFTSGSTSAPKGIILQQEKISNNISSILEWLHPAPGDGSCSWLPLSHDMGLIGMFLSSLVAAGRQWSDGGKIVIMTPEGFLRNPSRWLDAMAEFGSTITSSPSFGFEMAMKRFGGYELDLSSIRACITGAEPIRAATLVKFGEAFRASGFNSVSFCPAYGLAECTLAVAATSPANHWQSVSLDPQGIANRSVRFLSNGAAVVSCGDSLNGFEVSIQMEEGEIGEVYVRGNAIADGYSDGQPTLSSDGWLHTNDLGFTFEGQLYLVGRMDDVFQVAGRNIYGVDIEQYVSHLTGVRDGRVIAITTDNSDLVVVAESDAGDIPVPNEVRELTFAVRNLVRSRLGVTPRAVIIVERGSLTMTSSGKARRGAIRTALLNGLLHAIPGSEEP